MKTGRPVGYKVTEETKALMRQKKLGVKKTKEHRLHNSESQMGNVMVRFPDESKHRVYSQTFEDFLEEAIEKNWGLTDQEARLVWFMVENKREQIEKQKEHKKLNRTEKNKI